MPAEGYQIVKFIHILSVVFMSAPLYNLIAENERALMGRAPFKVDRYMENLIRKSAVRCYVFQITALVSGVILLPIGGYALSQLYENWVLLTKFLLLILLMILLSVVHFKIQPAIERLLATVTEDEIPPEVSSAVQPLRRTRKRLAGFCLFFVLAIILFELQVFTRMSAGWALAFSVLAGLFSWRVFRTDVRLGWS